MGKYILIICIMVCSLAHSQTMIRGTIYNADTKEPIDIANISVSEPGKTIMLNYAMTDGKGRYEIKYMGSKDSIVITVSGLNLKKKSRTVSNRSQTIDFHIESEAITLNEVKIKPPKIRQTGDTLNYLVESFTDGNDRTIGDVLKKMPGIQIQENGAILYQDKPINKFYIEDMDLLQEKYGIATNNIDASKVATVQVLENHQPIKALNGKEVSEHAALNLKLKDSAKGIFTANAQAGIGASPLLLSNEVVGMLFAKNKQDIVMYKGDNTGRDVSKEINSFYSNEAGDISSNKMLSIPSSSPPAISQQRHLFNDAHMGSINDLRKLNQDYTLTTNINYLYDRPEKNSYSFSEYYLPGDSILAVGETMQSQLYKNRLSTDIQLNANTKNFYFNNLLKLEGEWDRERGDALTDDSIRQHLHNPVYGISNTMDWTKVKENGTLKVSSFFGYKDISQTLNVYPLLYGDLFSVSSSDGNMKQRMDLSNFSTSNSVSWGKNGEISQDYRVAFNSEMQHLKSGLQGETNSQIIMPDSLRNDLNWNKYEWVFSPTYRYSPTSKINISLTIPVKYTLLHRNDQISDNTKNSNYLHVTPYVFFNYKISPFWSTYINYNYSNNIGGIREAYTGYIMTSYRNLLRNDDILSKGHNHSAMGHLTYKNPLTTLFGNIFASYRNTRSNLLNDYLYQGILRVKSSIEHPNTSENLDLSMRIGKDIDALASSFSVGSRYAYSSSSQLSQSVVSDYQYQYISISPNLTTRFKGFANINYSFNMAWSKSKIESNNESLPNIRTLSQKINLNIFPIKKLTASISCENFYNNAIESGSRSMWFGDISVKYKLKEIELSLDYTNIFNTKNYISTSYSDIGRYYYSYNLRPAEILIKFRFKLK
ncbi:MAG: carboxypeptidase-like regulatory domain-containing protein [Dysgonomonas sp.]